MTRTLGSFVRYLVIASTYATAVVAETPDSPSNGISHPNDSPAPSNGISHPNDSPAPSNAAPSAPTSAAPATTSAPTADFQSRSRTITNAASAAPPPESTSSASFEPVVDAGGTPPPGPTTPAATSRPNEPSSAALEVSTLPSTAPLGETSSSSSFARPWEATSLAVDRRLEVPAAYVARALTQPEGTLSLAFANYAAFIATAQSVGWVPVFAFGVTSDVEFAVSAPLRYDEGLRDWTFLDPIVDVTFKVADYDDVEIALRAGALFPVTSEAGAALRLGVPVLYRLADTLRLDAAAELMWTFEKPRVAGVRFPVGLVWQAAPWLYTGLGGAPNVAVSSRGKTSIDPFALVGLTLGARERAQMDVSVRFFVENLGASDRGKFADGAGTIISVGFFPDLY